MLVRLGLLKKGGTLLEHTSRRAHGWPVLLSLVVAIGACGDDNAVTSDSRGDTSTGTETSSVTFSMSDTTEASTTAVADSTATGTGTSSTGPADTSTSTTGDTDTTTGGAAIPGQTMNQLVTAGERTSSTNYTLVYTFGQPSSTQSTHQSTNYTIHGGLIGANGSPP